MNQPVLLAIKFVAGVTGLLTLAYAIFRMVRGVKQPAGLETGVARHVLRAPILLAATVVFIILCFILWRPVSLELPFMLQTISLLIGALIYFTGIGLYLWGMHSLGKWFGPSCGFGVRLHVGHRLIKTGSYRYIRHPMYLGVILAGVGGALIYWTWTMVIFGFGMLGLSVRARREDNALKQEFGEEWTEYAKQVPAWIPKIYRT